jgi:hypothetical protein
MLKIADIIKYLEIPQKNFTSSNEFDLPNNIHMINDLFKNMYYIKNSGDIYETILNSLDTSFNLLDNKEELIKDFRKKLWLNVDNAFKDYGYNRKRKFNKNDMKNDLLNFNKSSFDEKIVKYIADFFGINIYIIGNDIHTYLATDDSSLICVYKPVIIIYQDDNYYYPILNNNKGIFKYTDDRIVQDLYNRFVPGKMKSAIVDKNKPDANTLTTNEKKKPTTKMNISELQELAKEYNIDIVKNKNGKSVHKTKKDLYDDINNKLNEA